MYTCMKAVYSYVLCRLRSASIGPSGLQVLAAALTNNHTLKILRYVEVLKFKYMTISSNKLLMSIMQGFMIYPPANQSTGI